MSFNTFAPNSLPAAYPTQPISPTKGEREYLKEVTIRPIKNEEANSSWSTAKIILFAVFVFIGILVTSGGFGLAVAGIAAGKASVAVIGTVTGILAAIPTIGAAMEVRPKLYPPQPPLPPAE